MAKSSGPKQPEMLPLQVIKRSNSGFQTGRPTLQIGCKWFNSVHTSL